MFVLLMLFLFKYIDDLIGKGFDWKVIAELLLYAAATQVSMALPLAILLSSIMTFGSLGENYELVAIKSAGISLQKAMMPLVVAVGLLSVTAYLYSDYMLPKAYLKMGSLLYDVRNQKAFRLFDPGVFTSTIPGYSIRAKRKDSNGQILYDVIIYEHNTANGSLNVLVAKEGRMTRSDDNQTLLLKLKDGVRYEETQAQGSYDARQRFTRFRFKETEQKLDLSAFKLQRTDESLFQSHQAMLNLRQLRYYSDSIKLKIDSNLVSTYKDIKPQFKQYNLALNSVKPVGLELKNKHVINFVPLDKRLAVIQNAKSQIQSIKQILTSKEMFNKDYSSRLTGYMIEFHRKFTLSISCLVLFFIGAPLGAIIRKGGLGLPVVISVLFFLVYHIISTVGEKSVKEGSLSPLIGMWIAIFTLAPVGIFLTYKATIDSVLFDIDFYKDWLKKILPKKNKI